MMQQYKVNKIVVSNYLKILIGIVLVVFGVAFLINQNILTVPLAILFGAISLYHLSQFILRIDLGNQITHIIKLILFLVLATVFLRNDDFIFSTIGLFLVFWSIINTIIKLLNIYFYYKVNQYYRISDIFLFVLNLIISVTLIIFNHLWSSFFVLSFSMYLIYYGIELILLAFRDKMIKLPSFISMILPSQFVRYLDEGRIDASEVSDYSKSDKTVNIYVYLGQRLQDKVGHVDIGYEKTIYSYGAHDPFHRHKSFLWGDGVLIKSDEEKFIETSLMGENKSIIKFVYHLTQDERQKLETQIEKLLNQSIHLDWPLDLEKDYLTMLLQNIGQENISFYKFEESSIFKTYNLLKVNCVLMAFYLLNSSQIKLFDIQGLITPGSYYETLMYIYRLENSPISDMIVLKEKALH